MEETAVRARLVDLADTSASPALTATINRHEVATALAGDDGPIDLVLDVSRFADVDATQLVDARRVAVAWERDELDDLLRRDGGDTITLAFDGEELSRLLEPEFELHGLRETVAILAVAVAAGAASGVAAAYPSEGLGAGSAAGPQIGATAAAPTASVGIEAVRSAEPLVASSASTAAASAGGIEAVRSAEPLLASSGAAAVESAAAIEAVRSAEPLLASSGAAAVDSAAAIEAVRSSEPIAAVDTAAFASGAGIEAVRSAEAAATRPTPATDGGFAVPAPSPEATAALVGGFALLITGAAFVARNRRQLRLP